MLKISTKSKDFSKTSKNAEEALQLAQFSLDHAADAVFWMGPDARFVYVNDAACRTLGYSRNELLNMTVQDIDPDFPRNIWSQHWSQVRRLGIMTFESHHRTKNGKIFPVEISANFLEFDGREYNCVFARNITKRKKTRNVLKESEERYRTLVENVGLGITLIDEQHNIVMVNSAVLKLFGKTDAQLVGKKCYKEFKKRHDICPHCPGIKLLNSRKTGEIKTECVRNDGKMFQIQVRTFPMFDNTGKITGFTEVVEDITEQNRIENALKESEQRYRRLVETMNEGLSVTDEKFVFTFINKRFAELLGYSPDEIIGRNITEFFDQENKKIIEEQIDKRKKGVESSYDITWTTKDGRKLDAIISPRAFFDEQGNFKGSLGILTDITERKKDEDKLKLHEARLDVLLRLNRMTKKKRTEILDFVREEIIKITQSEFAFVGFLNENESTMTMENWSKRAMAECVVIDKPEHFPISKAGIWAEAVRKRKPVIINDYNEPNQVKKGFPKGHVPIKRFICVPVFEGDKIVMVTAVANKEKDYDESDVNVLTSMMHDTWRLFRQKLNEEEIQNLAKFPSENPNPVLRISKKGTALYANSIGNKLLSDWGCQIGEKIPQYWHKHVTQLFNSGLNKKFEITCSDNRIFSLAFAPIPESEYVNIYGTDVTERENAEKKILKLNEELEKRVAERTAKLLEANQKLLQEIEQRKVLEKEILDISEREQRCIGRELHDSVGQQFTGIAFMAKVLEQKLVDKMPEQAAEAAEISKLVNEATEQTRGLAKMLHPVDLKAGSIILALKELTSTTQRLFGVNCTFECDEPISIEDTSIAVHIYRITQEAITNAIRHGSAKNIKVKLEFGKERSLLTVENDGADFPKKFEVRATGMGLQIMDHRVDIIGGSLNIQKAANGGTVVTCMFPNKNPQKK